MTVKHTGRFRRDYKREKSGRHGKRRIPSYWRPSPWWRRTSRRPGDISITQLAASGAITAIAHIKPDLLLIYRKPDEASIGLVRLGSRSELGAHFG